MHNTAKAVVIPISERKDAVAPVLTEPADGINSDGITPEVMAVIQAAVEAYAGKKARVVSVKLVSEPQTQHSSWTENGLTLIHGSHNLVQRGH